MIIKPSTLLRNDYGAVSNMIHESPEPIYITRNGEGDAVIMSIEAYESREAQLRHRAEVLEAELNRLAGGKSYSAADVRKHLKEKHFRDAYSTE
ncbi:MAG: type II toxin-antitoxin system Phd/YefM family antitoxin [Clostridiales Family XIII bacterium]|jgi:PHD/YefM family antitoxin component YafN of YafNO toxin-antitoxin module|nr:type II toxin-antitoxin system Phd/YefM family antitoxin [Clostridiales Family XIII bacterium]